MKVLSVQNIMQLKINRLFLLLVYEKIEFIFEIEYIYRSVREIYLIIPDLFKFIQRYTQIFFPKKNLKVKKLEVVASH